MLMNTRTYNKYRSAPDQVSYAGSAHSVNAIDLLTLRRSEAKVTSSSNGVNKPSLKYEATATNGVTGVKHKMIFTISASLPNDAAVTVALVESMLADLASFIGSTDGKEVFTSNVIEN